VLGAVHETDFLTPVQEVSARPVKALPTPEGGMDVLAFDWETGEFKRDMSYVERIALPDVEVDIVYRSFLPSPCRGRALLGRDRGAVAGMSVDPAAA
jgi:hypothetical protein